MNKPKAWLHKPTVCLFRLLATLLRYRFCVVGKSNVPRRGGFVLAPNHTVYLDPPVIVCAMPRPVYFMAKQKLFKAGLGLLGLYFRHSGVFPVDPGDRKSEISALRLSVELAKKGRGVCVFPQGTRMPPGQIRKQDANSGMSYIAVKAGVPIVPMLIVYQTWGVTVQFGSPVSSDNREELTEKVVKALNVLRQSADRGRS